MKLKCEICQKPAAKNLVICSDNRCAEIRKKIFELKDKYTPTNGCVNCWGDLHSGCSEQCKREFSKSLEFGKDLWSIIRIIYPKQSLSEANN